MYIVRNSLLISKGNVGRLSLRRNEIYNIMTGQSFNSLPALPCKVVNVRKQIEFHIYVEA